MSSTSLTYTSLSNGPKRGSCVLAQNENHLSETRCANEFVGEENNCHMDYIMIAVGMNSLLNSKEIHMKFMKIKNYFLISARLMNSFGTFPFFPIEAAL